MDVMLEDPSFIKSIEGHFGNEFTTFVPHIIGVPYVTAGGKICQFKLPNNCSILPNALMLHKISKNIRKLQSYFGKGEYIPVK